MREQRTMEVDYHTTDNLKLYIRLDLNENTGKNVDNGIRKFSHCL